MFQVFKIAPVIQYGLEALHPQQSVTIWVWEAQSISASGISTPSYTNYTAKARVQPVSNHMIVKYNLELGQVYKSFYLLVEDLHSVNRNISTAGDYIQLDQFYYRIVKIPETYPGWTHAIGCQGISLSE